MNTVSVIFTCWCFFIFSECTGGVYGYVTSSVESAENKSEAKYLTPHPGKSKATKLGSASHYESLQNDIQYQCEDVHTCVQSMLANVNDISRTNVYSLVENIVLERVAGGDKENVISRVELEKLKDGGNGSFGYVTALLVQKTLDIFKTHSLKWKLLPGMDIIVFRNLNYGGRMDIALEVQDREPRTFGGPRKRLMLLLPIMYKMGVMTTMIGGLLVLTLKGLTIGVILLILAVSNLFSKHKHYGHPHQGPTDIHVHIHNDPHGQAYSGWHQEHVDQPPYHVEHSGHYRRRWSPPPQQPVPLPYSDLL